MNINVKYSGNERYNKYFWNYEKYFLTPSFLITLYFTTSFYVQLTSDEECSLLTFLDHKYDNDYLCQNHCHLHSESLENFCAPYLGVHTDPKGRSHSKKNKTENLINRESCAKVKKYSY